VGLGGHDKWDFTVTRGGIMHMVNFQAPGTDKGSAYNHTLQWTGVHG